MCNCKLSSVELKDAASADEVVMLVNDKEDAEGFSVLKPSRAHDCVSLLMCIVCAAHLSVVCLLKAGICRQDTVGRQSGRWRLKLVYSGL